MTPNWGAEATTVRLGYDLPRIHVIDGEYVRLSRGDLREEAIGWASAATRDSRADLRRVVLDEQARAQRRAERRANRKPIRIPWGWVVAAVFVAIVAAQVISNYRPAFKPYNVPVSTITTPYECGLGYGEHITSAVLESPGVNGSKAVYQVVCSSGETLALFQR